MILPAQLPSLLAFDLDGTLMADGGQAVPPATARAVAALQARGVRVALVTGRDTPPEAVREAVRPDAVATSNGGRVEIGGELRYEAQFDADDLRAVLAHQLEGARTVLFAEQGIFVDLPAGSEPEAWMVTRGYRPLAEAPATGIRKVSFYHPQAERYGAHLRQHQPHLVVTGGQPPYPHFLTITPGGAHKAAALARVADALGLSLSDTVAFGDSDNDVVMLELAGFAVQVGDLPLLRPYADAQLPSYLEVATYLEQLAALKSGSF